MTDVYKYEPNFFQKLSRLVSLTKLKTQLKGNFPLVGVLSPDQKARLEDILDIKIKNIEYFEQALIHRSYLAVITDPACISNERLEFLGDSVLELVISEYLFMLYTEFLEGDLTKYRSRLVNKNSLAVCAISLRLDEFIKLSFSAEKSVQSGNHSILADAMEAIIAAIYLDTGLKSAKIFIINKLLPIIVSHSLLDDTNYKSILLETVQADGKRSPIYDVIDESGPDHEKEFTVAVLVDDCKLGEGRGKSKKQAEQEAAKNALENIETNRSF